MQEEKEGRNQGNEQNTVMLGFYLYQKTAKETARYPNPKDVNGLLYVTLGLTGEAGEFANKVKKILRDDNSELTEDKVKELSSELGDLLWYASQCAEELDLNFGSVALENLDKLSKREDSDKIRGSGDNR